jgi:hypothetical protein
MARLFLRVGRRDNLRPADVVGAIANEAHMPGDAIGDIDIYENFSFVEVPASVADRVLRALRHTSIRGRPAEATLARPDTGGWRDDGEEREERRPYRPLRAPIAGRRPPFGGLRSAPYPRAGRGRLERRERPDRRRP